MIRSKKEILNDLINDNNLFTVLKAVARIEEYYSKDYYSEDPDFNVLKSQYISVDEVLQQVKDKSEIFKNSSSDLIKSYIYELMRKGFVSPPFPPDIPYDGFGENRDNEKDCIREKFYKDKDSWSNLTEIRLTNAEMNFSGYEILEKIKENKKIQETSKKYDETIKSITEKNIQTFDEKYKDKFNQIEQYTNDQIKEINKNLQNNIIKNVEVMSIFIAIITIILTNIFQLRTMDIKMLLIVNLSIIITIISLFTCVEFFILNNFSTVKKVVVLIILPILVALFVYLLLGNI